MPHLPCWANLYFDGAIGNRAWPLVIVVSRWPMRTESGRSLSYHSLHLRLVVVQVHLRRAADHVQVDDVLGLGREVRARRKRAVGPAATALRPYPRGPSRPARAAQPTTFLPRRKNWRRVSLRASSSIGCMEIPSVAMYWSVIQASDDDYLLRTSSRLRSWFASIVHAAS